MVPDCCLSSALAFPSDLRFPMQGNYHFAITNGMRDSAIVGLSHIGLRIEYSNMNEHYE